MAAVLFAGAKAIGQINSVPTLAHKIEHFVYYAGMAALLAYALGPRRIWMALLVVPLIGALDEWHQLSVAGRNGSPLDWLVDLLGGVVGVYVVFRATVNGER